MTLDIALIRKDFDWAHQRLVDGGVPERIAARIIPLLLDEIDAQAAEIGRLLALAYLGDHYFPDNTYKARYDEAAAEIGRLRDLLAKVYPHIPPTAIDGKKARTHPMSECYLNTMVRDALAAGDSHD